MDGHAIRDVRRDDLDAIAGICNEVIAEGASTFETEPRTACFIASSVRCQVKVGPPISYRASVPGSTSRTDGGRS